MEANKFIPHASRKHHHNQSFYLCIACAIQNLYILIYPPPLIDQDQSSTPSPYCTFCSIVKTTFDLSAIIWTLMIIYSSYATVVRGFILERFELLYLGLGFLLPLVLAFIPFGLNLYGYDTFFCWFSQNNPTQQFWLKFGYFFGPLWIFFFLQMYWAYQIYRRLKKVGLEERDLNIFKKILLFPIILLVTGFFATGDLIYDFLHPDNTPAWLDGVSLVLLSAYGFFTAIAYGLNPLIRDQIMILLGKKRQTIEENRLSTTSQSTSRNDRIAQLITL